MDEWTTTKTWSKELPCRRDPSVTASVLITESHNPEDPRVIYEAVVEFKGETHTEDLIEWFQDALVAAAGMVLNRTSAKNYYSICKIRYQDDDLAKAKAS